MYSAFRRLMFLLFTLLHTKSAVGILVQDHGYVYKAPAIKSPLSFLDFPTQIPNHIPASILQQQPPSPQYHYGFPPPPTLFDNFLNNDEDVYYNVDGRLLKQYEVMERIIGDLKHPENFFGSTPVLLDSFFAKLSTHTNAPSNFFDFSGKIATASPNRQFIQPVTKNHGPVALGSGSLGYIQLANGAAYLGSGSLGYISGQQANQAITDAKTRKGISPPSPLHFGHGFQK